MAITVNSSFTSGQRHVIGDLSTRFYNLTGTGTADTFTVPFPAGDVLSVDCQPTTNVSIGATWAAGTAPNTTLVTFVASGAWTAVIQVIARAG